jgi:hypothetical protein
LKPPAGETATARFAVCPAEIVVGVGETGASEKSCPVPARLTVCGLSDALSVIVKVPALAPLTVGSKKTPIAQLEPAATLFTQVFKVPKSAAFVVTALIVSVAVPVLVTVTVFGRPEVPTYCAGKAMLDGVTEADGATPAPVSATVCGLGGLVALSVILNVPVRVPVAVGEKVTFMVQLAPAAKLPMQLSVSANSEAFVPLIVRPEMVKVELPVLVNVMP